MNVSLRRRIAVDTTAIRGSRDFRLLAFGQLVSSLGTQAATVALHYQAYVISHPATLVGLIAFWGLAIACAGLVSSIWPAAALLAAAGWADGISAVCRTTISQSVTPGRLRGRMGAAYSLVVTSGPRLGDMESGFLVGLRCRCRERPVGVLAQIKCQVVMRELKASATAIAPRPIERCFTHLAEIERYPEWYPQVIKRLSVLERDADGRALKADALLAVAAGPLRRELEVRMQLATLRPTLVALARVADARGDHEALAITWKLAAAGESETEISLEMTAYLDVPRFLPIGQITAEIASGFVTAAVGSLT